jgi:hypothetical protein
VIVTVDSAILDRGMPFERGSYSGQVQVAADPAESLAGLDHSGGAPAQRHLSIPPTLTLREWSRQISITLSTQLVLCRVRARVGARPGPGR